MGLTMKCGGSLSKTDLDTYNQQESLHRPLSTANGTSHLFYHEAEGGTPAGPCFILSIVV